MIHITEVTTKAQLRQFVNFPIDLYRDVPQYIPGTYSDDLADWDREKNPAFSYCEARCWLASRDDGTLVGRIGAILSRKSNDKWGTHRLRFTQVDFIDDREVSAALFQTVEDWARQLGCTEVHGPLGFTDMDREGMLVEGFDRTSCFFTYYNHPYYIDHLTALGYGKDVDWTENLHLRPHGPAGHPALGEDRRLCSEAAAPAHPSGAQPSGVPAPDPEGIRAGERGLCPPVRHRGAVGRSDPQVRREVRPPHQA